MEQRRGKVIENSRMRRARRRRKVLIVKILLVLAALAIVIVGAMLLFGKAVIKEELTIEAGSKMPEVTDFLEKEYKDVKLISGLDDSVDMNTVVDYQVVIEVKGKEYTSVLHVTDTTDPVVTVKNMTVFIGTTVEADELIEKIEDATAVTVAFVEEPDWSQAGTVSVKIIVTDEGGNSVEATVDVEVVEDTEAPVIEGVEELTITAGTAVSYKKGITVTDNYDENVELTVDTEGVDLNTPGDYTVTYHAVDTAGNEAEVTTTIHVKMPGVESATEELVNAKADELLAQITTPDMSQYEKAEAIFFWVHENVAWSDGTPKTNWIQGAYRGLVEKRGDCYVYASTSKCLLTRAGITNMDIGFSHSERTHYWNLIDIGEGWHHFDNTRRKDGSYFFYKTDEEVMAYSNSNNGSHAYDPAAYPDIQ